MGGFGGGYHVVGHHHTPLLVRSIMRFRHSTMGLKASEALLTESGIPAPKRPSWLTRLWVHSRLSGKSGSMPSLRSNTSRARSVASRIRPSTDALIHHSQLKREEVTVPERVQLSRAKGWKMPPNTVKVDRTTKYGNPFVVGKPGGAYTAKVMDRRHTYMLYRSVAADNARLVADAMAELRGKNLACWCPKDDPYEDCCHAAVLLEIANPPSAQPVQTRTDP